ncbi:MAG: ABC transporter ATP-binding protein/permease [Rikenellaceae bacterium]|nr:ABC transporter ATP-binding protein/permease [Rikenellaceae bacterium]
MKLFGFKKISVYKYFLRYIKRYIKYEIILIILMLLASAGTLVSPYILKLIIDDVFPSSDYQLLIYILLGYVAIVVFRVLVSYGSTFIFEWVSNHIMKDMRVDLFTHLIRLPLNFYDNNKTGDIIHRINSEVNSIQNILTNSLIRIISSLCLIIGLVTMLSILNFKLFLISLAVFPVIFLNTLYFQPKIHATIKESRKKDSDILSFLMERFANIKLLKNYMRYDYEKARLDNVVDEQISLNMKITKLSATNRNISTFFTAMVPVVILGIGGMDVMKGAMTIGTLVAFIQYMNRMFDPFRDLMGLYYDMIRASVSMERIHDIITIDEEANGEGATNFIQGNCDIVLNNVSFKYKDTDVLKNINIKFESGKKYALVGASVSGKSTILNLLCRFYEIDEGSITIGNINIKDVDLKTLRNSINHISQDNQLFHDTILNNITYANENENILSVENTCRLSGILEFIDSTPKKWDTMVGDQGTTLSGGQKQRISIARSLLKVPQIILLDEATSAIDSENEREILQNICRHYTDKTIIITSHRLSTIKFVDEIIYLQDGKVIESGSHNELIKKRGYYWNLFKDQIE